MFSTPSCNSVQHDYEKGEASNKKQNKKNKNKKTEIFHIKRVWWAHTKLDQVFVLESLNLEPTWNNQVYLYNR